MTVTAQSGPSFTGLYSSYQDRSAELIEPADRQVLARRISGMGILAGQLALAAPGGDPKTSPETWNTTATWLHAIAAALEGDVPRPAALPQGSDPAAWRHLAAAGTPTEWTAAWNGILPPGLAAPAPGSGDEIAAGHILRIAARITIGRW